MREDPLGGKILTSIFPFQSLNNSLFFCSLSRHRLNLWISQSPDRELAGFALSLLKSTGLYITPCFLLLSPQKLIPFLRQMGEHPRKLLRAGKTCSFPRYDLPLNSFTPADHHAANERTPIKRPNGRKKTKKENLGDETLLLSRPPCRGENELKNGPIQHTRCFEVSKLSTTPPVSFSSD